MSNDPRHPGFSFVSPYITVEDVDKTAAFYQKAFGFEVKALCTGDKPDSSQHIHGELFYKGESIMIGAASSLPFEIKTPKQSAHPSPMSLFLYVDDVDAFHQHAVDHGAISYLAPEDAYWGDRMCRLADIDGYVWAFATTIKKQPPPE